GDIAAQGLSWSLLTEAHLRAVVFYELLGIGTKEGAKAFNAAKSWLDTHQATSTCRPALSPHAPYSTHYILYDVATRTARERGGALATHLAETTAELELLATRTGPFVDFLKELAVWKDPAWTGQPHYYVKTCYLYARQFLLVHCNYLPLSIPIPPD